MARKRYNTGIAASAVVLFAIMGPNTVAAAPQTLDCVLTDIEISRAGSKFESQIAAQKRSVAVVFDDSANTLTVKQDGADTPLSKVTISQTSMTGAGETISIGIDRSSWRIVFQTYEQGSTRNEFGRCVFSR